MTVMTAMRDTAGGVACVARVAAMHRGADVAAGVAASNDVARPAVRAAVAMRDAVRVALRADAPNGSRR